MGPGHDLVRSRFSREERPVGGCTLAFTFLRDDGNDEEARDVPASPCCKVDAPPVIFAGDRPRWVGVDPRRKRLPGDDSAGALERAPRGANSCTLALFVLLRFGQAALGCTSSRAVESQSKQRDEQVSRVAADPAQVVVVKAILPKQRAILLRDVLDEGVVAFPPHMARSISRRSAS